MNKEKQGNRSIDLYILFSKLSIDINYFCVREFEISTSC